MTRLERLLRSLRGGAVELARRMGVTTHTVRRWAREDHVPQARREALRAVDERRKVALARAAAARAERERQALERERREAEKRKKAEKAKREREAAKKLAEKRREEDEARRAKEKAARLEHEREQNRRRQEKRRAKLEAEKKAAAQKKAEEERAKLPVLTEEEFAAFLQRSGLTREEGLRVRQLETPEVRAARLAMLAAAAAKRRAAEEAERKKREQAEREETRRRKHEAAELERAWREMVRRARQEAIKKRLIVRKRRHTTRSGGLTDKRWNQFFPIGLPVTVENIETVSRKVGESLDALVQIARRESPGYHEEWRLDAGINVTRIVRPDDELLLRERDYKLVLPFVRTRKGVKWELSVINRTENSHYDVMPALVADDVRQRLLDFTDAPYAHMEWARVSVQRNTTDAEKDAWRAKYGARARRSKRTRS